MTTACKRVIIWPGVAVIAPWLVVAPVFAQQVPDVRAKDFSLPIFDDSNRLRYLVRGESANPVFAKGQLQVTQFRLESYSTNKALELTISAPECLFDAQSAAWSPGRIQVQSADGQLSVSGDGFLWRQTNGTLIISNRVATLIRRGVTNTPGGPTTVPARSGEAPSPITVAADHAQFDIQAKTVTYQDNVQVDDPEMALTSGLLTVNMKPTGAGTESIPVQHTVDSIFAKHDVRVRIKQGGSEAMADEAVYRQSTDQVELSGNAAFKQGPRTGKGDRLIFNRRAGEFQVEGHAVVQLPRAAVSELGLLLTPLAPTNAPANPTGLVEALADSISSRSNLTVLRGNVRLLDSTNRLTCGLLTVRSATADDPEETATAEQKVMVEQGNRRVWADRAVHTKSSQTVVFSGNPHWNIDQREGSAETLVLNLKENVAHASNAAYVKIPLAAGGQRLNLLPRLGSKESPTVSDDQAIEIAADDLEIGSSVATFAGHVRAHELPAGDARQRMACGVLTIKFTSPSNQIEQIEATRDVTLEQGTRGATNTSAVWQSFSCDVLTARVRPETGLWDTATAQGKVVIEQDQLRATGSEACYAAEKGTLELTGNPRLTTPQVVITEAEALLWSLASNKYWARGNFKMQLFPEARGQPGPFQRKKNQSAQLP